jgi:chloramphenicol 3-O phosphotransferase
MSLNPTIILLNGISSSGKTSISRELQAMLEEPYFQVSIDAFEDMLPERYDESGAFAWESIFPTMLVGFHRAVAGLASVGANQIVDHVMVHREGWMSTLADCLVALKPYTVYFVGVRCSLEEALRREQARGDRYAGTAARQYPLVHQHGLYDIEVDTTQTSAEECARAILAHVSSHPPQAFARLREAPAGSLP